MVSMLRDFHETFKSVNLCAQYYFKGMYSVVGAH